MSKRLIACMLLSCWIQTSMADVALFPISVDLKDQASLQRGAKLFMNYCSGCHSLRYLRYNRMAEDLGLTMHSGYIDKDLLINNLIFTGAKASSPMDISMPSVDARQWFGKVPPDLSLSARQWGAAWLYTYLKTFYVDKSRPFGANNILVPDVAMPNVLAPLEGVVIAVKQGNDTHLYSHSHISLIIEKPGEMSVAAFDRALRDVVTFLVYVAEPVRLIRFRMGLFVMLFLGLFLAVVYALKKHYWREVSKR